MKWFIIDLSGMNDIHAVAIDSLEEMMRSYEKRSINFIFAGMKGPIHDLVAKAAQGKTWKTYSVTPRCGMHYEKSHQWKDVIHEGIATS